MAEKARKAIVLLWLPYTWPQTQLEVWTVFDQEEPPSAAVWGPSARLGAKSAFVEFVDGGAVFCSGSSGPPLPLSARRGTSSLYAARSDITGRFYHRMAKSLAFQFAL